MRKILFALFFAFLCVGLFAKDLNDAQKKVRSGIMYFLKEEGYMPELDSDGDILFKKEGMKYHVAVSDIDTSPMYVVLFHNYRYDDTYTKNKILSVLNEVNLYKAVKLLCFDAAYSFRAEMYLVDAEQFKYTFYKLMSQLASMEDELEKLCTSSTAQVSSSSFRRNGVSSSIRQYFPIYGITLGKSTSDDLKKLGYEVKDFQNSGKHVCNVHTVDFWDHDKDNIYEQIYLLRYEVMPEEWVNNHGFRWDLSYKQWMALFKKEGFTIVVTEQPISKKYQERMTLSASFTATSIDKALKFNLNFNYGNSNKEGYSVSSKNSLFSIRVQAKG